MPRCSQVLPPLEAGGEGGGGGDHAGGGGAAEDGGHRDPGPREFNDFASSPGELSAASGPEHQEDRRRAAHLHDEPAPPHRVAAVRREAEEGQGGSVPRPAGRLRRAGAGGGAGPAPRPAGEAAGHRSAQGEAGGDEAGWREVHMAARGWRHLRLHGPDRDRPRRPPRARWAVHHGQLSRPLRRPQQGGSARRLRRRAHGPLHPAARPVQGKPSPPTSPPRAPATASDRGCGACAPPPPSPRPHPR